MSIVQHKRTQLQNLVKRFEDDNKEYSKIASSVEEKVISTLTDKKALLQLALASLFDTIKRQPDMYSNLLMISPNPTGAPFDQNYSSPSINGQSQVFQDRYVENYKSMILGEAEKLYDKMVKDLVNCIMGDITYANVLSSSATSPVRDNGTRRPISMNLQQNKLVIVSNTNYLKLTMITSH